MTHQEDKQGDSPMLLPNSFIIPSDVMDDIMEEAETFQFKPDPNIPNAFTIGLSYISARGSGSLLSPEQLEHIPVGIQEHSIATGTSIVAAEGTLLSPSPSISPTEKNNNEVASENKDSEAYQIAKKIQKQSAKNVALAAQKRRISRRLLLAERSKKLTVTCPISGIVSLLEVPAIPFPAKNPKLAKALQWTSPFADLDNCRGLAQQGAAYLSRLDTQTLAGILIVLADSYELFRFRPFESGAQKNAIIRTAGKDHLIDGIILIENLVHSGNATYLPKLSMVFDSIADIGNMETRMHSYLRLLADAIAKPDKEAWDDKKIKPLYPIRPVYIKDIKNAEKKVSFLARQEQARAKKEFAEDKKAGKLALSLLSKQAVVGNKLKILLQGALSDEGLITYPSMILDKMMDVLGERYPDNLNAKQLIKILGKDRKALTLSLEELEENIEENLVEEEQDEPAPGQEEAIEEPKNPEICGNPEIAQFYQEEKQGQEKQEEKKLEAPAGLSAWDQLRWKKKIEAAQKKERTIVQTNLPSTAVYIPSESKEKLGRG